MPARTLTAHPPREDLERLADVLASGQPVAWHEDNQTASGSRLFLDLRQTLLAWTPAEVPSALAALETSRAEGAWAVLAATHELGYALEPRLMPRMPFTGRPLLEAWVWGRVVALDAAESTTLLDTALARLPADARCAGVLPAGQDVDSAAYRRQVAAVQALIAAGDCYQVNLTFGRHFVRYGDDLALYARLRDTQPVRYGAFIRHARGAVLSRSPELFVERRGTRLTTRPMKGTAPPEQAEALCDSAKDRAENLMIVDLLRNDLGRLAPAGGVRVEQLFEVERYPTVAQMISTIIAEPVEATLTDTLRALFPCGSVTGAPKIRALEVIRELECAPRGLYCGALGWIAPDGDFTLSVPIRTLEVGPEGQARMGIGSGIVADSDPAGEEAECEAKARFLTGLPAPFSLIETLRIETDGRCALLDRHLARMQRSAAALGFAFDRSAVLDALRPAMSDPAQGPRRVRLALAADGALTSECVPLDALPVSPTVALADDRLDAADPLLAHKTTRRARYDAALAAAREAGDVDWLFQNRAGELCEGARSNLILDLEGRLWTPPVACGLLPGVMRESLLAEGRLHERRLGVEDLRRASRVFICNALRGVVEVRWRER